MTPRPIQPEPSRFDEALRLAAAGRYSGAMAATHAARAAAGTKAAGDEAVAVFRRIARQANETGDRAAAVTALGAAARLRPRWADVQFERATVLVAAGERSSARAALRAALALNPAYAAARLEWALLDASEGLVGEALEQVRALMTAHGSADLRALEQGLRSLERADWEEAGPYLRRGLGLADEWLGERLERIRAALAAGQWSLAAQLVDAALERHATYPDLHALLGDAEAGLGQLDDAAASYARALELNPDFHAARLRLARTLEGLGLRDQALDELTRLLATAPDHSEGLALEREWSGPRRRPVRRAA